MIIKDEAAPNSDDDGLGDVRLGETMNPDAGPMRDIEGLFDSIEIQPKSSLIDKQSIMEMENYSKDESVGKSAISVGTK